MVAVVQEFDDALRTFQLAVNPAGIPGRGADYQTQRCNTSHRPKPLRFSVVSWRIF